METRYGGDGSVLSSLEGVVMGFETTVAMTLPKVTLKMTELLEEIEKRFPGIELPILIGAMNFTYLHELNPDRDLFGEIIETTMKTLQTGGEISKKLGLSAIPENVQKLPHEQKTPKEKAPEPVPAPASKKHKLRRKKRKRNAPVYPETNR